MITIAFELRNLPVSFIYKLRTFVNCLVAVPLAYAEEKHRDETYVEDGSRSLENVCKSQFNLGLISTRG